MSRAPGLYMDVSREVGFEEARIRFTMMIARIGDWKVKFS